MFILPRRIRRRGPGKTNRRSHQSQPGRKHRATGPEEAVRLGETSFGKKPGSLIKQGEDIKPMAQRPDALWH